MTTTVEIQTETAKDALSVPIQAVTTRVAKDTLDKYNAKNVTEKSNGNEKTEMVSTMKKTGEIQECVFVLENGTAKKVNVKSGIQDNTYIQIP